jgi:hypothetical protein
MGHGYLAAACSRPRSEEQMRGTQGRCRLDAVTFLTEVPSKQASTFWYE